MIRSTDPHLEPFRFFADARPTVSSRSRYYFRPCYRYITATPSALHFPLLISWMSSKKESTGTSSSSPVKPVLMALDQHTSSMELPASNLRVVYLNQPQKNVGFAGNQVVTAKYNVWTFVPAFCYERFTQVSNFYFLLVGIGQVIPAITSTFGLPYSWSVDISNIPT
ncbi:hypothetical protein DYB38_010027 [Aphanomyces astaci]|uniref:P-type ATPase N-terminal domain-containing protein n=1 Tax=Aphanomyces astaci TaxID=112090 RepID=A0A397D6M9_APHAT|nr:hypothetical protein DYB38_010027 [Aphanomyces astaci]